jgi:hypothetical protein
VSEPLCRSLGFDEAPKVDSEAWMNILVNDIKIGDRWHMRLRPALADALAELGVLNDIDTRQRQMSSDIRRMAALIQNRVAASGSIEQRLRPDRYATDAIDRLIMLKIEEQQELCALCGRKLFVRAENRLLQMSADRINSQIACYDESNIQITQLACNFAKNDASVETFNEWLRLVRE